MRYVFSNTDVEVEVMQVYTDNGQEVADWCGGLLVSERDSVTGREYPGVNVPTPSGNQRASIHWYIVKDVNGNFHVIHPCTFVDNYTLVEEDEDAEVIDFASAREALGFSKHPKIGFDE